MDNIKTFENFNNQDIFLSIKNNDIESVKNYIDSGYDLNIKNDDGATPLIYSVYYNKIKIIALRSRFITHPTTVHLNDVTDEG